MWKNYIIVLAGLCYVIKAEIIKNGVTCDEIKEIVNYHNSQRRRVASGTLPGQPKAKNMQRIVWDEALSEKAQKWADKSLDFHNPDRSDIKKRWENTGENLYREFSPGKLSEEFKWKNAIDSWFNEYKDFKFGDHKSNNLSKAWTGMAGQQAMTGHYTQLVWHNTMYVGCGATYAKTGDYSTTYICNYGPPGNIIGKMPYDVGAGCSNLCCTSQHPYDIYGEKC